MPRSRAATRSILLVPVAAKRHQFQFGGGEEKFASQLQFIQEHQFRIPHAFSGLVSLLSYKIRLPDAARNAVKSRSPAETVS